MNPLKELEEIPEELEAWSKEEVIRDLERYFRRTAFSEEDCLPRWVVSS